MIITGKRVPAGMFRMHSLLQHSCLQNSIALSSASTNHVFNKKVIPRTKKWRRKTQPLRMVQRALDFNDFEQAFQVKYSSELIRALLVYKICAFDFLVQRNKQV